MSAQTRWKQHQVGYGSYPGDSFMHLRDVLMTFYLRCRRSRNVTGTVVTLYRTLLIVVLLVYPCAAQPRHSSQKCKIFGYTRTIEIEDCLVFEVSLNGCGGYCESWAHPSFAMLPGNRNPIFTSRAECCSMTSTETKRIRVACKHGIETKEFKSALTCSCSVCRS